MDAIKGYRLEFINKPFQSRVPNPIKFSQSEHAAIDKEIDSLLSKNAIRPCTHCEGEFISNIFTRPKKSGGLRVILNLKQLNKHIIYNHFKMENLDMVKDMIFKDDFLASIDLTDAYFCVRIHDDDTKYLRFIWNDTLFEYTCLPFGYSAAPRLFTKITKPVLAELHSLGIRVSIFIDDIILVADSVGLLNLHVFRTISLLNSLGFKVNFSKSHLTPSQCIRHLGFMLNSTSLEISLPLDKIEKIKSLCFRALYEGPLPIRQIAQLVGVLISSCVGTKWGKLFYRDVERDKIKALHFNAGNFDAKMSLSDQARDNLLWWLNDCLYIPICFDKTQPSVRLQTDASGLGWGCVLLDSSSSTGGRWNEGERINHINFLELLAAFLGIRSFCSNNTAATIHIELDNTVAISYINEQGGIIQSLDHLSKEIWLWAKSHNKFIFASHIPGKCNNIADSRSRIFHDNTEWSLNQSAFDNICCLFGQPSIDLFASRLNNKCKKFCSWEPCPDAWAVDSFSIDWGQFDLCYAFPPFSLIGRSLSKMFRDKAELLLIVPNWNTQYWYPLIEKGLVTNLRTNTYNFVKSRFLLYLPYDTSKYHELWNKLNLVCFRLSGKR